MIATKLQLFECGCCGSYHFDDLPELLPDNSNLANVLLVSDCRYDAGRFACAEDAAERLGVPVDTIEEINLDDPEHPDYEEKDI